MVKPNLRKIFFFCYFMLFLFIFSYSSILSLAQVKTLMTLNLSENEAVYNIYTDSLQTNYAVVIKSITEGMVSSVTEYYIITPKEKLGPFERVYDIAFFDSGKQRLISVKKDGSYYVYKNNDITGPFENLGRFSVIYSTANFAYWVKESGKYYVIYQDKKLGPYAEISSFVANQKTNKIVWKAKIDKFELFVNGTSTVKSDLIVVCGFYTEKAILSYIYGSSGSYYMVVGSTSYGPYENIGLDLAVKDENLAIFFAKISGTWYLIAGKEKAGPFDALGQVAISPDGKKIAYAGYKESSGWGLYIGAKLIKNINKPYFSYLDFVKVDAATYDILYLVGEPGDEYYNWYLFIGTSDEPAFEYQMDSDSPYVGTLNINYYGVDFMLENEGSIALLNYENGGYNIGIYSLTNNTFGIFGPGEDYDTTYVLDVANNVVFFVLNGEFFVGVPSDTGVSILPGYKTIGRIVYGLDGKRIGVVYFDSKNNTICFTTLNNVVGAISSIYIE